VPCGLSAAAPVAYRAAEFVATAVLRYNAVVPKRDASQEALRQVEKATESEPVCGEGLLGSEDLKRKLREAKERLAKESPDKSSGRN